MVIVLARVPCRVELCGPRQAADFRYKCVLLVMSKIATSAGAVARAFWTQITFGYEITARDRWVYEVAMSPKWSMVDERCTFERPPCSHWYETPRNSWSSSSHRHHAEAETSSNRRSNCENLTNELASFGCRAVHNKLVGLEEADAFYRS